MTPGRTRARAATPTRTAVHAGLIATTVMSLVLEPTLTLHLLFGFAFVILVIAHLAQRRRVSRALVRRLAEVGTWLRPAGRLALSDLLLTLLTLGMLGSGLWDWVLGHPTKTRWHALSGVLLTVYLVIHTLRRRGRLRHSRVR